MQPQPGSNIFLTVDVGTILKYPMIISGPSGCGKTVAALQLAPTIHGLCQPQRQVTVGVYLREYKNTGNTDMKFHELASKISALIQDSFGGHQSEVQYESVHVHIVLDEMGGQSDLIKDLVGGYTEFKRLIREAYPGLGLSLAIVGTGVDCSGMDGQGSIGHPLWRLFVQTSPTAIVKAKLGNVFRNNDEAIADIMARISDDHLLSNLIGNLRCAAYLANMVVDLKWYDSDFRPISTHLAQQVAANYVASNGWRDYAYDPSKYLALLIATLALQGRGCHILSEADIRVLCKKVGAMDDRQVWLGDDDAVVGEIEAKYTACVATTVDKIFDLKGNAPAVAGKKELKARLKHFPSDDAQPMDHIRFHIPLSIALVVIIRYATLNGLPWPFRSYAKSPAATNEQASSVIIMMIQDVLASKKINAYPSCYLFPQLEESLFGTDPNIATITAFSNTDDGSRNPITVTWPPTDSKNGIAQIFTPNPSPSSIPSLVVEVTPEVGAQNHMNIFGEGLIIGVENKFIPGGSVSADVFIDRAQQMGYEKVKFTIPFASVTQAGYEVREDVHNFIQSVYQMDTDIVSDSGNQLQFTVLADSPSPQNKAAAVRSSLIREIMMKRRKPKRLVEEAVLLCCPADAIPEGCSISFENQLHVKLFNRQGPIAVKSDTINKDVHDALAPGSKLGIMSTYQSATASVIPWKLTLMGFLGSASGATPPKDPPPHHFGFQFGIDKTTNVPYLKAGRALTLHLEKT